MPMNATTSNAYSGMTTLTSWEPLAVLAGILTLGFLFFLVAEKSRLKKLGRFFKFLAKLFVYAGKGLIGLAIVGSVAYPVYLFGQGVKKEAIDLMVVGKWSLIGLAGFFGLVGFGFIVDKLLIQKIKEQLPEEETEDNESNE